MWIYRVGSASSRALADFTKEQLAYLALTCKLELPFRDRLAYEMYLAYPCPPMCTVREWKGTDIAVIENGTPVVLLELKALYSFDAVNPATYTKYKGYIEHDVQKAKKLAGSDTEVMITVIMTHVTSRIPDDLAGVVKYRAGINGALATFEDPTLLRDEACRRIQDLMSSIGESEVQTYHAGDEAMGLPVDVDVWTVGRC